MFVLVLWFFGSWFFSCSFLLNYLLQNTKQNNFHNLVTDFTSLPNAIHYFHHHDSPWRLVATICRLLHTYIQQLINLERKYRRRVRGWWRCVETRLEGRIWNSILGPFISPLLFTFYRVHEIRWSKYFNQVLQVVLCFPSPCGYKCVELFCEYRKLIKQVPLAISERKEKKRKYVK